MTSGTVPFSLLGLDHVVLRVRDLKRMMTFYVDVLGCSRERDQPELGLYQVRAGRSLIDFVTIDGPLGRQGGAPPAGEAHNVDHFCIVVTPFDDVAIRRHLAENGYEAGPPANRYGAEGDGPSIYLDDPEGNRVELKAMLR